VRDIWTNYADPFGVFVNLAESLRIIYVKRPRSQRARRSAIKRLLAPEGCNRAMGPRVTCRARMESVSRNSAP
jgi:hypothetical protein